MAEEEIISRSLTEGEEGGRKKEADFRSFQSHVLWCVRQFCAFSD